MSAYTDKLTPKKNSGITSSDISMMFTKHPITGDVSLLTNEESIKQSLVNIILTNLGERVEQPTFGSDVRRELFSPQSDFTEENVYQKIQDAIKYCETRVKLLGLQVSYNESSNDMRVLVVVQDNTTQQIITLDKIISSTR